MKPEINMIEVEKIKEPDNDQHHVNEKDEKAAEAEYVEKSADGNEISIFPLVLWYILPNKLHQA